MSYIVGCNPNLILTVDLGYYGSNHLFLSTLLFVDLRTVEQVENSFARLGLSAVSAMLGQMVMSLGLRGRGQPAMFRDH